MWLNDDFTTNDFTSIVNISKEQKERFSFRIQWESLGDNEGRDTECFLFSSYTETQKLVQEFVWVFLLWSDPPACTSHVINQRTLFSMTITAFPKKKAVCQAIWKRVVEQIWEINHIYDLKLQWVTVDSNPALQLKNKFNITYFAWLLSAFTEPIRFFI